MEIDTLIETHRQLEAEGYTILKGRAPPKLLAQALNDLQKEIAAPNALNWRGGGKWFGHVNYLPDPRNQVIAHVARDPQIKKLIDRTLGSDYKIIGLAGNANLPNSRYQPAHVDGNLGNDILIVNIPIGDVTEQNGSTELWPSTNKSRLSYAQFTRSKPKSIRLNSSNGDVLIRYPNVWHRGTPNHSADVRFMLGLAVSTGYGNRPPLIVTRAEAEAFNEFLLPVHYEVGEKSNGRFRPNYFPANFQGNAK